MGPLSGRQTTSTERERRQRLEILSDGRHEGFPSTVSVYRKRQIKTAVPGGVRWGGGQDKEKRDPLFHSLREPETPLSG